MRGKERRKAKSAPLEDKVEDKVEVQDKVEVEDKVVLLTLNAADDAGPSVLPMHDTLPEGIPVRVETHTQTHTHT